MHPYTPTTGVFHPTIDLIDDSDAPTASNFNVAPGSVADNAAYNKAQDDIFHPEAGNAYTNVHNAQYMLRKSLRASPTPPGGTTTSTGAVVSGNFSLLSASGLTYLTNDVYEFEVTVPIFIVDNSAGDQIYFNSEVIAVVGGASSAPVTATYSQVAASSSSFERWATLTVTGYVVSPAPGTAISLTFSWEFFSSGTGSIGFVPTGGPAFTIPIKGPQVTSRLWTPVV